MQPLYHPFPVASTELPFSCSLHWATLFLEPPLSYPFFMYKEVKTGQDPQKTISKVILPACLPLRCDFTCMCTSQKWFYLHVYLSEVILPACLPLRSDSTGMFTSQKWFYLHVYLSEVILPAYLPLRSYFACLCISQKWFYLHVYLSEVIIPACLPLRSDFLLVCLPIRSDSICMFSFQKWFYLHVYLSEVILLASLPLRSDSTCMFTSQKWFYLHVYLRSNSTCMFTYQKWFYLHVYLCTWLWCRCQHGKVVLVRVGPWLMPSMFLMPDWPAPCQKSTPPLGLTTKHFIQVHRPVAKHFTQVHWPVTKHFMQVHWYLFLPRLNNAVTQPSSVPAPAKHEIKLMMMMCIVLRSAHSVCLHDIFSLLFLFQGWSPSVQSFFLLLFYAIHVL